MIEKLLIGKQRNIGPDIRQEERFAPTWMGKDHIGDEALIFEEMTSSGAGLATNHFRLSLTDKTMDTGGVATVKFVSNVMHAVGISLERDLSPMATKR